MTELDFDKLGEIFESIREGWEKLTPEQKAEIQNKVDSAIEDSGASEAGTEDESEFQRRGSQWAAAGAILETAGALSLLGVVTAPAAPVLFGLGAAFVLFGLIGKNISVERAKDIGSWLSSKHPKAYAIFCANPALLYGNVYWLNQAGPWYMMDSCSVNSDMLTAGSAGIVAPGDITSAATIPDYPNWASSSSSSSSSSSNSSNLLKLGLVAGAAYLILK